MGLLKRSWFEAVAFAFGFAASAAPAAGQLVTLPQFSGPYGGVAVYGSSPSETPGKPAAGKTSKSKVGVKKQPAATSALRTVPEILADPITASMPPVAPSAATNAHDKDSPLGIGLKWYGATGPSYNAGASTIPGVDEIKRDSNQLLGEPSSTGSGIAAGVNLKF